MVVGSWSSSRYSSLLETQAKRMVEVVGCSRYSQRIVTTNVGLEMADEACVHGARAMEICVTWQSCGARRTRSQRSA